MGKFFVAFQVKNFAWIKEFYNLKNNYINKLKETYATFMVQLYYHIIYIYNVLQVKNININQ